MGAIVLRAPGPRDPLDDDRTGLISNGEGSTNNEEVGIMSSPYWPSLEAFRKSDALGVRVDLPGIDPEHVEVSLHGRILTVRGERKAGHDDEDVGYREVRYGQFERSLTVPEGIDPDAVQARYVNGVLEITMPVPKGLVPRRVPVTVGGPRIEPAIAEKKAA
jgi:HSP20 family protein